MDLNKAKKILKSLSYETSDGTNKGVYTNMLVRLAAESSKVVWDDKHKTGVLYDESGKELTLVMDAPSSDYKWRFDECKKEGSFIIKDPNSVKNVPRYLITSDNVFEFNDEGLASVVNQPTTEEECEIAKTAINYCPTAAIEEE